MFGATLFAQTLVSVPKLAVDDMLFDGFGRMAIYGAERSDYRHFAKRSDLRIMSARLSRRPGGNTQRLSIWAG
jgi:hypothetical protein